MGIIEYHFRITVGVKGGIGDLDAVDRCRLIGAGRGAVSVNVFFVLGSVAVDIVVNHFRNLNQLVDGPFSVDDRLIELVGISYILFINSFIKENGLYA
ncbi:hypothetical protein SDC9_183832 [bioreactor metagenome]|uniref:Uncharacterized protein n=1 Tax=bioreactor metagenome TaxID=1076179 RepID=A0A645HL32_9ZZZZ